MTTVKNSLLIALISLFSQIAAAEDGIRDPLKACYHIDVPSQLAVYLGEIPEYSSCAELYRESPRVLFHHTTGIILESIERVNGENFLLHLLPTIEEHDPKKCIIGPKD